jgi:DNA replication protein DnaC
LIEGITGQIPVERWHDLIGDPTRADAIPDRIVHDANRIQLRGESLRRKKAYEWESASV